MASPAPTPPASTPASTEALSALTPPGAGAFTTIHFVLIALLIAVTVVAIVAGMRRKRARKASDERVEAEAQEAGVPPAPPAPEPDAMRAAPLSPRSLDRSASGFAPAPATDDDIARPRPVAPGPDARGAVERAPAEPPAEIYRLADDAATAEPLDDERIAAAAPMDASPATIADPTPAASPPDAAASPADGPVTQLKGLGPKVAARLAELDVTTVGQIAALDADQAQSLDSELGPFRGRLHRDRWVEQARFLAAGDRAGFEAVFGRL